jgi:hypothetical protein
VKDLLLRVGLPNDQEVGIDGARLLTTTGEHWR